MVCQNSAVVLLGRYSQTSQSPDQPKFNVQNLVATTEFVKLVLCLFLIGYDEVVKENPLASAGEILIGIPLKTFIAVKDQILDPMSALPISIPAGLYLLQNNILYVALKNLTAPVFQVTYQSKLVTTALVSVVMLQRRYASLQWISLVTLGVGVAVVVLGEQSGGKDEEEEVEGQSMILGLCAVAAASLSSAFAGVYFEKVLKGGTAKPNDKVQSVWMRNIQLAFFSLVFSSLYSALGMNRGGDSASAGEALPFFYGFTTTTYMLVVLQALGGLLVAAIVKYADNVVKGLATGVAVVVSTIVSAIFLGSAVTMPFVVGAFIILTSVWVFGNEGKARELIFGAATVESSNDKM